MSLTQWTLPVGGSDRTARGYQDRNSDAGLNTTLTRWNQHSITLFQPVHASEWNEVSDETKAAADFKPGWKYVRSFSLLALPGLCRIMAVRKVEQQSFTKKIDQGLDMLVLSRKKDEKIVIGDSITLMVIEIRGDKVRLGIEAPRDVTVHREEVYEAIKRENTPDNKTGK